jgi:hypothetical protein
MRFRVRLSRNLSASMSPTEFRGYLLGYYGGAIILGLAFLMFAVASHDSRAPAVNHCSTALHASLYGGSTCNPR